MHMQFLLFEIVCRFARKLIIVNELYSGANDAHMDFNMQKLTEAGFVDEH